MGAKQRHCGKGILVVRPQEYSPMDEMQIHKSSQDSDIDSGTMIDNQACDWTREFNAVALRCYYEAKPFKLSRFGAVTSLDSGGVGLR